MARIKASRLMAALNGRSAEVTSMERETAGQHDLIFYANRSTPQVVARGAAGRPKEGYGKQTKRRAATAEEEKKISTGAWLRVDQSGKKGGEPGYKKTKLKGREHLVRNKSSLELIAEFTKKYGSS